MDIPIIDFVKNHNLLKEDYRQDKGFATFEHVDITKRLQGLDRTCVLALVGPYGSGKSTALYRAKNTLSNTTWLQFDAWRYPERKALWDGLIIETARQLGADKKILRAVDGNKAALGKWGGVTTGIFATLAGLVPDSAKEWLSDKTEHVAKVAVESKKSKDFVPQAEKIVNNLFGRSAAKRAYEFEKILTDLLLSIKTERIIIVAEDIDRSGSDGLHFLETLSFYLKNNEWFLHKNKTIIAVAPVSDVSYKKDTESYLKCVDYVELFRPRRVNLDTFIEEVFKPLKVPIPHGIEMPYPSETLIAYQTKYFLEGLFNTFPREMNMRKLKMIIREASSAYKLMQIDGFEPDWLIVLCIQAAKYVRGVKSSVNRALNDTSTYYDIFVQGNTVAANTLFSNTISAIYDKRRQDEEYRYKPGLEPGHYSAKNAAFIIDDSLDTGGVPIYIRGEHGEKEFHLQGYYFRY